MGVFEAPRFDLASFCFIVLFRFCVLFICQCIIFITLDIAESLRAGWRERVRERERSIDDAFHLAWINRLQTVSIRYLIWLANTWHKKEYITAMKRFTRCGFIGFLCVSVLFVRWIWQLICQHMKWERKSGKTHTHAQRHTHTAHNEWGEMLWELFNSANVGKLCRGIWIQQVRGSYVY